MNLYKPGLVLLAILTFLTSLLLVSRALAGPGAHGPNGEHLDAPAAGSSAQAAGPRFETFTESFELVGQLHASELSILIDRYETNEPVLNGKLEIDLNGIKAIAKFHADHGDYAFEDARLLKALKQPGKHALVFTFSAGDETDLLDATLEVKADTGHAPHDHVSWFGVTISPLLATVLSTLLAIGLVAIVVFVTSAAKRRRKQLNRKTS